MKKSIFTRLFALLCLVIIGGATAWADDNSTVVNAPTITPGTCTYNGTIMPVITADEGCSIVYVKSTSKVYTTVEDIDANKGVKTENSNKASITDIQNKTGNRYISAYAVKDINGTKYKSAVTTATYTYDPKATNKADLTLSGQSITLDMSDATKTTTINITATSNNQTVTDKLTYRYEVYPDNIISISEDGIVTPKQAGTASITVIFEGNDKYNAATCVIDVNVASKSTSTDKIFYSIADIRHATQPAEGEKHDTDKIKNTNIALIFDSNNPATVVAVMQKSDERLKEKVINTFFIVDNSNRGLWITQNDLINPSKDKLAVGSKITGTILGTYTEGERGIPSITEIKNSTKEINGKTYTMAYTIDHSGEAQGDVQAAYPYTEIADVNTLAKNNDKEGDIVSSSYGVYLNSIVKLPGVIKLGPGGVYYLMQDESTECTENFDNYRLSINTDQVSVNLSDYINTSGIFEGILIKLTKDKAKLVILKDNFFQINKIYLDENDPENRIDDLVNAGAFDDEVDVYVHRTKLVNSNKDAWNALCFPFDLTAAEFKTAFGCELSALAQPKVNSETTVEERYTKVGETDKNGNLLFTPVNDITDETTISEGMPYLMKATGTQTFCANTSIKYQNEDGTGKTPQDLMGEDANYYAHIGQKFITVVPPHQIQGNFDNNVVNGNFYFRGLYGRKANADNSENDLYDNGSQKYQYISTADNYLKYLTVNNKSLKFPGMRAYFYFPNWKAENNKPVTTNGKTDNTNAKIHIWVEGNSTTGISNIEDIDNVEASKNAKIYNLAGQVVDESYKGIVIKNGRKYLAK